MREVFKGVYGNMSVSRTHDRAGSVRLRNVIGVEEVLQGISERCNAFNKVCRDPEIQNVFHFFCNVK